jgi:hypothetical protein
MAAPVIPGVSESEELLVGMVSEAKGAGIERVMWDMYNPKPIAHSRLMGALERSGIRPGSSASPGRASDVRRVLARECTASGIQLTDAF